MATHRTPSTELLKALLEALNNHDLDLIMSFFSEDCCVEMPRGPESWGLRRTGKSAVRDALASRFVGIPDVHYSEDRHFVFGDFGVSEWLLTGTAPDGSSIKVKGCDHFDFRDGKIVRKDSYWKIVE